MGLPSNRRAFLASLVSFVSLGAGAWWWWRGQESPPQPENTDPWTKLTAETLRQLLPYLQVDDDGVAQFARDLRAKGQHTLLHRAKAGNVGAREWLGQQFLLSSDFFWNGADVSKIVRYRAYYDPYVQPCANPFARQV